MRLIVGIDEVGRGPLAGPLVAGAVILPPAHRITNLKDSKKLSDKQRQMVALQIRRRALAIGTGWASPRYIDRFGLTAATRFAMSQAVAAVVPRFDRAIIDGSYNFLEGVCAAECVVDADEFVDCVSAASIIAKVARDNYMRRLAVIFPEYGFEKHVGYGTARHRRALQRYGRCSLHRQSFAPLKLAAAA